MAGSSTFTVEVLTPEGEVFNGEVTQLSTKTVIGEIGILAGHVPILAALEPNLLRLKVSDSETQVFAQSHGTIQVFANHVQVLLEQAILPSELDVAGLEAEKSKAEARLADSDTGDALREDAKRDLQRVDTFLAISREA